MVKTINTNNDKLTNNNTPSGRKNQIPLEILSETTFGSKSILMTTDKLINLLQNFTKIIKK